MSTRARIRTGALAGSLTLLLALASPAFAQTPEAPIDASVEPGLADTEVDEDTDANDDVANNVVDDGDDEQPSGNDRSVESGGSGNQGSSESDPDSTTNGGADVPGGSGGTDPADQDGNNGCGNDDDFEDDNNGNCGSGRPTDVTPDESPVPNTGTNGTATSPPPVAAAAAAASVLGTAFEATTALAGSRATPTQVVGGESASSPQSLPRTGLDAGQLALASMGMIAVGFTALTTRARVLAHASVS